MTDRHFLDDAMLERFSQRAAVYDRENRFFTEDFDELRDAGYLTIAVPREFGGGGYSIAEVGREQRRLGYHAAATALAINMHVYWSGVAADLWRSAGHSLEWLLREAMSSAVFSAGHAESGNDIRGAALNHSR
ncbi:MAG: acyl-CoA dehydrogenase family protein [Chthoniobacterales bacterium]